MVIWVISSTNYLFITFTYFSIGLPVFTQLFDRVLSVFFVLYVANYLLPFVFYLFILVVVSFPLWHMSVCMCLP